MHRRWLISALVSLGALAALLTIYTWWRHASLEENTRVQAYNQQIYQDFSEQLEELLQEYQRKADQYYQVLKEQADKDWQEQLAQSEKEYAENVAAYQLELEQEAEQRAELLRKRYEVPILNLQLKLAMLTLADEERSQLEQQLADMRTDYRAMRQAYEQELNQKLEAFQAAEAERQKAKLLAWEEDNAAYLSAKFAQYQADLNQEYERAKEKLETNLRRAMAVRE